MPENQNMRNFHNQTRGDQINTRTKRSCVARTNGYKIIEWINNKTFQNCRNDKFSATIRMENYLANNLGDVSICTHVFFAIGDAKSGLTKKKKKEKKKHTGSNVNLTDLRVSE